MMKNEIIKPFNDWKKRDLNTKCKDISEFLSFSFLFLGIIFSISYGYLDFVETVHKNNLSHTDEEIKNMSNEQKNQWSFVLLCFALGAFIVPFLFLYYITRWFGYGIVYLGLKIYLYIIPKIR